MVENYNSTGVLSVIANKCSAVYTISHDLVETGSIYVSLMGYNTSVIT